MALGLPASLVALLAAAWVALLVAAWVALLVAAWVAVRVADVGAALWEAALDAVVADDPPEPLVAVELDTERREDAPHAASARHVSTAISNRRRTMAAG